MFNSSTKEYDTCLRAENGLPVHVIFFVIWGVQVAGVIMMMLWTYRSAKNVVADRLKRTQSYDSDNDHVIDYDQIEENYETLPSEYLERRTSSATVFTRQNTIGKIFYSSLPNIEEDDDNVSEDNSAISREANQLLRMLTQPDLLMSKNGDRTTEPRSSATENNIGAMITGMLRITGSVAVVSGSRKQSASHD